MCPLSWKLLNRRHRHPRRSSSKLMYRDAPRPRVNNITGHNKKIHNEKDRHPGKWASLWNKNWNCYKPGGCLNCRVEEASVGQKTGAKTTRNQENALVEGINSLLFHLLKVWMPWTCHFSSTPKELLFPRTDCFLGTHSLFGRLTFWKESIQRLDQKKPSLRLLRRPIVPRITFW